MSDYKRFVAYLYEYRENTKRENRGFVRVESRSGTCQMGFQMKVISLPEGAPLNVYGFVRLRGSLFGIPVGILRSGKNGISGRLMTPSVHMGDTAFSLSDLSGLLITGPEGRVYATQWDDIPIDPGRFTTDPSILREPDQKPFDSALETSEDSEPEPSEEVPEEVPSENILPEEKPAEAETLCMTSAQENPETVTAVRPPLDRWKDLTARCPHIQPFDDDEIHDCVRLELKDLPDLRRSGWQIGNSQFLLHAFYNYRHFLIGRSASMDDAFILGVPGIFDVKEQFMAGMFGFSGFKPAHTEGSLKGNAPFGYWYRQVQ